MVKMLIQTTLLSSLLSLSFVTAHAGHASQITEKRVTSNYAKTKYPLVFAHGMGGWIRAGTDELGVDYWYQILPDLARNGGNVWATRVSPFNTSEVRGEQLRKQVDEVLALTGKDKVNLFGHSHGGHSIAYIANTAPHKVASATAIASPLKGSKVADFILTLRDVLPVLEAPVVGLVNFGSKAIVWAQGLDPNSFPHDSLGAADSLRVSGSLAFSQKYPLGMPKTACGEGAAKEQGIYFYSISGNAVNTHPLDPDNFLTITAPITDLKGDNDGMVSRCSAKFGKTIRDNHRWNHLDAINQFFGLTSVLAADPVTVYRQHANRLKNQGL